MTTLTRRELLKAGLALGVSSTIAITDGAWAAQDTLVVVSWGGAYQKAQREAWFKPFEKTTGVKIVEVSPTNYGKFKAMVTSGNVQWDVVDVDSDWAYLAAKKNLLEELDYGVISTSDLDKSVVAPHSVGDMFWAEVIAYNTNSFDQAKRPRSWTDVWNTKEFPGPRSLENIASRMLPIALLADGVHPAELYPLDVKRAFKSLDKIRPHVTDWFTTGSQSVDVLARGETAVGAAWSGRVATAKAQGRPVNMEFNQGLLTGDSLVVPKGAPHKELAMKFINFALQPQQQAALAKHIPYGPTNKAALKLLSPKIKEGLANSEQHKHKVVRLNEKWTGEHDAELSHRWYRWMVGG